MASTAGGREAAAHGAQAQHSGNEALILAVISGILLALSFPRYGYPAFAWIALVPLIVALFEGRARPPSFQRQRAFLLGFVAGAGYFGGTVYWTGTTVRQFGGLSWPIAVVVAALLVAYLSIFPGLFAMALGWLGSRLGPRAIVLAPAIWVTTELGRTYFWSGFPWLLLGYSQTTVLPVAQIASVIGVFGLSAFVALVSAALAYFAVSRSSASIAMAVGVGALLVAVAVWGTQRVVSGALTQQGTPVRVALVQGNIPQDEKWDERQAGNILNTYLTMTRDAAQHGAKLVIWPESSTPFLYGDEQIGSGRVREVVKETGIELLLGSDQLEHSTPPKYFNAAFLVRRDGATAGVYRKMHLVPFGEFVPLKQLLFFVGPLVEQVGGFEPGESMVMLPTSAGPISTAICYEIVYPALVRDSVLKGSRLLTTITNDAWYGYSSAPYQHFLQASMRAIEQGRYLARAANTGISGIVDPYGRVIAQSRIFERAVLVGDVRMIEARTVYGTIGDACAYACALVTLAALVLAYRTRR
jgi:apolipoprotein N-acyltransferase